MATIGPAKDGDPGKKKQAMREGAGVQRFLRPARRLIHRQAESRGRRFGRAALVVATAVASLWAGAELRRFALTTDRFAVEEVIITGADRIDRGRLEDLRDDLVGRNLLALDLETVEAGLRRTEPWVAAATVRRIFPSRIELLIVERRAAARLDGDAFLLARDGALLPAEPVRPGDQRLPLITGAGSPASEQGLQAAIELIDILRAGRRPLLSRVREIDVADGADLVLRLVDTDYRIHVGGDDFVAKLNRYQNVEPLLLARYEALESVDLRFRDRVVVAPVAVASNVTVDSES